jgi:hypothetical protein
MVCGKWASNMEKDISIMLIPKLGKEEFGMKEKELDGFNLNKETNNRLSKRNFTYPLVLIFIWMIIF